MAWDQETHAVVALRRINDDFGDLHIDILIKSALGISAAEINELSP
jgi:hypothetical protein